MPGSKTAGDACTSTVISLEDSGVVAFISSFDVLFSPVAEAGRAVVCATSVLHCESSVAADA
eukprot:15247815-Ditylum_brightwellii.AAC.1